eukprot:3941152-Rhodomonas_salina.1
MSGTELRHGGTRERERLVPGPALSCYGCSRPAYALPDTERAVCCYAGCGTGRAYAAMRGAVPGCAEAAPRYPVLTYGMVLRRGTDLPQVSAYAPTRSG